jgi:hypothetical protein
VWGCGLRRSASALLRLSLPYPAHVSCPELRTSGTPCIAFATLSLSPSLSLSISLALSLSLSVSHNAWSFREPKQLCPKVYCDVQDPQAWTAALQTSDLLYFSLKLFADNVSATCEVGEIQLRVKHCILKRVETLLQGHSRCQLAAELVILSSVSSYLET